MLSGDDVRKVEVNAAARALPAGSLAVASTVTVWSVLTASGVVGVKVTLRSSAETASATGTTVAPAVRRTDDVVRAAGSSARRRSPSRWLTD